MGLHSIFRVLQEATILFGFDAIANYMSPSQVSNLVYFRPVLRQLPEGLYNLISRDLAEYIKIVQASSNSYEVEPPTQFKGNALAWKLVSDVLDQVMKDPEGKVSTKAIPDATRAVNMALSLSSDLMTSRSVHGTNPMAIFKGGNADELRRAYMIVHAWVQDYVTMFGKLSVRTTMFKKAMDEYNKSNIGDSADLMPTLIRSVSGIKVQYRDDDMIMRTFTFPFLVNYDLESIDEYYASIPEEVKQTKFAILEENALGLASHSTIRNMINKYIPHATAVRVESGCVKAKTAKMVLMGDIVLHWTEDNGYYTYNFGTVEHFNRSHQTLSAFARYILTTSEMSGESIDPTSLLEFFKSLCVMSLPDPDFMGEYIKASRNLLIAGLDTQHILGEKMSSLLEKEFDPAKREIAKSLVASIQSISPSPHYQLFLANLYKAVPHPDPNLEAGLLKTKMTQMPNEVSELVIPSLRGMITKSVYMSLLDSKYTARASPLSEDKDLATMCNATQPNKAALNKVSHHRWALIRLAKSSLPEFSDINLPINDKSSMARPDLSKEELEGARLASEKAMFESTRPKTFEQLRAINDVVSELNGVSKLNLPDAVKHFRKVVKNFENFEKGYLRDHPEIKGNVDKIDTKSHEEFVMDNLDYAYFVGTEPKLGEYHKRQTRIFYYAEQTLKVLTQRIERVARQVSRLAPVSITKTYVQRRRDLEGVVDAANHPPEGFKPLFISFDMSSFSAKFPPALLRLIGKILADVTGEESLARLDVIFKASVVIHNSRGYFNYYAGVKGGFEGFFNFLWTLIHSTVMSLALHHTGMVGVLLTFSDDGLLQVNIPIKTTTERVASTVKHIIKIYSASGLEFNINKTLVSPELFEYLGDLYYRGHIIEMFGKQLCSIGRMEEQRVFATIYDKIRSMSAQAEAAIRAGSPPISTYLSMLFEIIMYLKNRFPNSNERTLFWFLIIPEAMGGIRIPSLISMLTLTTLDSTSDFYEDMELLNETRPSEVATICFSLGAKIHHKRNAFLNLLLGHRLRGDCPDTTGTRVLRSLSEHIIELMPNLKTAENPVDESMARAVWAVASGCSNVDLNLVSTLAREAPKWKLYHDQLKLARSTGALRLLPRDVLRRAQARDTRNFRSAMDMVAGYFFDEGNYKRIKHPTAYLEQIVLNRTFAGIDIAPIRLGLRATSTVTSQSLDTGINIRFSLSSHGLPKTPTTCDIPYPEPTDLRYEAPDRLSFKSQLTLSREESYRKSYAQVAAAVLAHNPSLSLFVTHFSKIMGVDLPPLNPLTTVNISRARASIRGRTDASLFGPKNLRSLNTMYTGRNLAFIYTTGMRADRTTYATIAKALAIEHGCSEGILSWRPFDKARRGKNSYTVNISIHQHPYVTFTVPSMAYQDGYDPDRYIPLPIQRRLYGSMTRLTVSEQADYNTVIKNQLTNLRLISTAIDSRSFENDITPEFSNELQVVVTYDLSKVMNALLIEKDMDTRAPLVIPRLQPHALQLVGLNAIRLTFYEYMRRNKMTTALNRFSRLAMVAVEMDRLGRLEESMDEKIPDDLHPDPELLDAFSDFKDDALRILQVRAAGILDYIDLDLMFSNSMPNFILRFCPQICLSFDPNFLKLPIMVLENEEPHRGMASAQMVRIARTNLQTIYHTLWSSLNETKWSMTPITRLTQAKEVDVFDSDEFMDIFAAVLDTLRESTHRTLSHPCNPYSMFIQYYKLRMCVLEAYKAGLAIVKPEKPKVGQRHEPAHYKPHFRTREHEINTTNWRGSSDGKSNISSPIIMGSSPSNFSSPNWRSGPERGSLASSSRSSMLTQEEYDDMEYPLFDDEVHEEKKTDKEIEDEKKAANSLMRHFVASFVLKENEANALNKDIQRIRSKAGDNMMYTDEKSGSGVDHMGLCRQTLTHFTAQRASAILSNVHRSRVYFKLPAMYFGDLTVLLQRVRSTYSLICNMVLGKIYKNLNFVSPTAIRGITTNDIPLDSTKIWCVALKPESLTSPVEAASVFNRDLYDLEATVIAETAVKEGITTFNIERGGDPSITTALYNNGFYNPDSGMKVVHISGYQNLVNTRRLRMGSTILYGTLKVASEEDASYLAYLMYSATPCTVCVHRGSVNDPDEDGPYLFVTFSLTLEAPLPEAIILISEIRTPVSHLNAKEIRSIRSTAYDHLFMPNPIVKIQAAMAADIMSFSQEVYRANPNFDKRGVIVPPSASIAPATIQGQGKPLGKRLMSSHLYATVASEMMTTGITMRNAVPCFALLTMEVLKSNNPDDSIEYRVEEMKNLINVMGNQGKMASANILDDISAVLSWLIGHNLGPDISMTIQTVSLLQRVVRFDDYVAVRPKVKIEGKMVDVMDLKFADMTFEDYILRAPRDGSSLKDMFYQEVTMDNLSRSEMASALLPTSSRITFLARNPLMSQPAPYEIEYQPPNNRSMELAGDEASYENAGADAYVEPGDEYGSEFDSHYF